MASRIQKANILVPIIFYVWVVICCIISDCGVSLLDIWLFALFYFVIFGCLVKNKINCCGIFKFKSMPDTVLWLCMRICKSQVPYCFSREITTKSHARNVFLNK